MIGSLVALDAGWATSAVQGSMAMAIPVAAFAGLVSFFSPCVLPLLPGYLSLATGLSVEQVGQAGAARARKLRIIAGTSLFVLGFAVVFVLTGAVLGGLGGQLLRHQRTISIVAGVLIFALGLMFAGWMPFGQRTVRLAKAPRWGLAAAPLMGFVFGVGWTPCIGPTLSVVLTLAVNEGSADRGAWLAFCYALGLGVPFLVAGLAMGAMSRAVGFVRRHQRALQVVGAVLMMAVGILLVTGIWDKIMAVLRQWAANVGMPI